MKPTAWNLVVISPQSPCLEKIRVSCQAGLILIAAGVACSLVFSLRGVDRRVVAVVYTLPQLLLLLAKKRPNNTTNEG